jgi:hypothetical protein
MKQGLSNNTTVIFALVDRTLPFALLKALGNDLEGIAVPYATAISRNQADADEEARLHQRDTAAEILYGPAWRGEDADYPIGFALLKADGEVQRIPACDFPHVSASLAVELPSASDDYGLERSDN